MEWMQSNRGESWVERWLRMKEEELERIGVAGGVYGSRSSYMVANVRQLMKDAKEYEVDVTAYWDVVVETWAEVERSARAAIEAAAACGGLGLGLGRRAEQPPSAAVELEC